MTSMARQDRPHSTVAGGIRRGAQASRVHGMDDVLLEALEVLEVLEMLGKVFMRECWACAGARFTFQVWATFCLEVEKLKRRTSCAAAMHLNTGHVYAKVANREKWFSSRYRFFMREEEIRALQPSPPHIRKCHVEYIGARARPSFILDAFTFVPVTHTTVLPSSSPLPIQPQPRGYSTQHLIHTSTTPKMSHTRRINKKVHVFE